jgi:CCR4-NOT transcriptional regulation complex NOT5 subunit
MVVIQRHKHHISKLEMLLRLLDNEAVDTEKVIVAWLRS